MKNNIKIKWIEFCGGNTLLAKKETWDKFKLTFDKEALIEAGMELLDYKFNMASVSWSLKVTEYKPLL